MPTPGLLLSRLSWVGIAKETTLGTPVTPTLWIPVTDFKPEDIPQYINDESMRANSTLVSGVYLGEEDAAVSMGGVLYPEVIGFLLVATGNADTVSGSGTFTHTFKIPATGAQPPSYTFTYYSGAAGANARQYPGMVLDSLDLNFDAKGVAKYSTAWKGWPSVTLSKPTPTWTNTTPLMGWEVAPSVGGSANPKLVSAALSVKRSTEAPHTLNNTRNPYDVFAGPIEASWKFKMIVLDETDWLHIINNDQPALSLVATSPYGSPAPVLTFTHLNAAWVKAPMDLSQKWVQLDADLTGFYNSTDLGPVSFTLQNGVSTAY